MYLTFQVFLKLYLKWEESFLLWDPITGSYIATTSVQNIADKALRPATYTFAREIKSTLTVHLLWLYMYTFI